MRNINTPHMTDSYNFSGESVWGWWVKEENTTKNKRNPQFSIIQSFAIRNRTPHEPIEKLKRMQTIEAQPAIDDIAYCIHNTTTKLNIIMWFYWCTKSEINRPNDKRKKEKETKLCTEIVPTVSSLSSWPPLRVAVPCKRPVVAGRCVCVYVCAECSAPTKEKIYHQLG